MCIHSILFHSPKMNPATRTKNKAVRWESPLSAFLSSHIKPHLGSPQAKSKIVLDNPVSHGPKRAGPSSSRSIHTDSGSVARTISTSSSSLSSLRWDPNIILTANKNSHQDLLQSLGSPCSESSSSVPSVPVRRDSPEEWHRKQKKKPSKRMLATGTAVSPATGKPSFVGDVSLVLPPPYPVRQESLPPCDLFVSRSEPDLSQALMRSPFGSKDSLSKSALLPPPFPIRQVSLSPCDLFVSRSEPNLAQMHLSPKNLKAKNETKKNDAEKSESRSSPKKKKKASQKSKEGEQKKKKSSPPKLSRSAPKPSASSVPTSPGTPKRLIRWVRSSLSPKKRTKNHHSPKRSGSQSAKCSSRTPSPTKRSAKAPPKIRKRDKELREAFRSVGIPHCIPLPIIEDDENTKSSGEDASRTLKVPNTYRHLPTLTRRRSRRPAVISIEEIDMDECIEDDLDYFLMRSPRSNLQEGRSLVSALTSLPTTSRSTHLASRSTMESHRSLSETLLSCDRDEPVSPVAVTPKRRNKKVSREHKRAPPVQPIRQLSRAILEL